MRENGFEYGLILDSDEVISPDLLDALLGLARLGRVDLVRARLATYFLSPTLRIQPDEQLAPIVLLNCQKARHRHIREYDCGPGERSLVLGPEFGLIHHLSWVGSEERIERKLATSSHRPEFVPNWKEDVWDRFKQDRTLRNLHPTHPHCYARAERVPLDPVLEGVTDLYPVPDDPLLPENWPSVSVVIPLHGGPDDIRACLTSLECAEDPRFGSAPEAPGPAELQSPALSRTSKTRLAPRDRPGKALLSPKAAPPPKQSADTRSTPKLIREVIVVDDASPDDAAEVVAAEFPWVELIRSESNLGFGATCNKGYEAASEESEAIVFLNSDTVAPRASLIRLIETLMASGSVGAAGPYSNNAGYHQPFQAGYSDVANLGLFARDFADRQVEDIEVPMLVGFCLAVRRSVLKEIGGFDTRYGRGLFEDNDLVYRIQRAGYKLRLASRSYVHHEGSRSLNRSAEHPHVLLERNKRIYEEKWREDLLCGFASHLPGQNAEPIRFDPNREPSKVRREMETLARKADISLCMIVRNEERVLGDCLTSVQGMFQQVVIVDTGSTDRTVEIATEHGAEVYEIPWPDSFAAARNESLEHAKGKWIFWLDADDTMDRPSLEAVLRAAVDAPRQVAGFVVPVRFVEEGQGAGTQVDHVKLFRNHPGVRFEGRIHEQILASLRRVGGEIVRLSGPIVLHSGYDSSPEGQSRKRERDHHLLWFDLMDDPTHPFKLFNCGMTAHYNGNHRAAIGWLRRSISRSGPTDSHVRKAYALMGASEQLLGRHLEALGTYREGLRRVGEDPELRFRCGIALAALGRLEEARDEYLAVVPDTSGFFSSVDLGILTFKRLNNLALVCEQLGRHEEAVLHWREAIRANPSFAASAISMFEACMRRCDLLTAQEAVDALLCAEGPSDTWARLRATVAEARGQDVDAELAILMRQYPMATAPGMLLARRMIERGEEDHALPLLRRLDDWGCPEAAFYEGVHAARHGASRRYTTRSGRSSWIREARRRERRSRAWNGSWPRARPRGEIVSKLKDALGKSTIGYSASPFDLLRDLPRLPLDRWYPVQIDRRPAGRVTGHELGNGPSAVTWSRWDWEAEKDESSQGLRIDARPAGTHVKVTLNGTVVDTKGLLRVARFSQGSIGKIAIRVHFIDDGRTTEYEFHGRIDG